MLQKFARINAVLQFVCLFLQQVKHFNSYSREEIACEKKNTFTQNEVRFYTQTIPADMRVDFEFLNAI